MHLIIKLHFSVTQFSTENKCFNLLQQTLCDLFIQFLIIKPRHNSFKSTIRQLPCM